MKILFLLAPSEGKNIGGEYKREKLSFSFLKPIKIANNATEKTLKCSGNRFREGVILNKNIDKGPFTEAIVRYSGVVFNAIDYLNLSDSGKKFFEDNVLILSGMYGLVKPLDHISNYKLPIEGKGLYTFWGENISLEITRLNPYFIVNLLPESYAKLIGIGKCSKLKKIRDLYLGTKTKIININFFQNKEGKIVKISHGVKKHRGNFLKNICENNLTNYEHFGGEIVKNGKIIDINILK